MNTNKALRPILDTSKSETPDCCMGPYTEAQLNEAFDLVKSDEHWKNPIEAYIEPTEVELVSFAVEFFTATKLEVVGTARHSNLVLVKAAGYFNGPAN